MSGDRIIWFVAMDDALKAGAAVGQGNRVLAARIGVSAGAVKRRKTVLRLPPNPCGRPVGWRKAKA